MARGWESKSVELQQDEADRPEQRRSLKTESELKLERERESLELSRVRVLRDLEAATHPRHRQSIREALQFLDEKIAALQLRSE